MRFTEGYSVERPDASWLKISVSVDDSDFCALLAEWFPDTRFNQARAPLGCEYDCLVYLAQKFLLMREVKELQDGPQPPNAQRQADLVTRMQRLAASAAKLRERIPAEVPLDPNPAVDGNDPWTGT